MKRFMIAAMALIAFWITSAATPVSAADDIIEYFSVSLVNKKTHHLTPIKIYTNGKLTLDRRMHFSHGATFFVKVIAPRGRFVSAVFRDEATSIYDLPQQARRMTTNTKEFMWTMPRRFVPGSVEFFVCLWASMNPEAATMDGALERTGWITLGDTNI